nr:hypothetical protein CFP56_04510 [Quercus suber]
MPLHRARKRIPHQLLHQLPAMRRRHALHLLQPAPALRIILVLQVDLVVQKRHDQTRCRAGRAALLSLIAAHGVVAVQRALAFLVDAAEDGRDVVGEEALLVQDVAQALRARVHRDVLAVLVLVHLHDRVEALGQRLAVGGEADDRQHDLGALVCGPGAADAEELGGVARVDVVAGGAAGVAREDGEVLACDPESRAAIVGVSVSTALAAGSWRDGHGTAELTGKRNVAWAHQRLPLVRWRRSSPVLLKAYRNRRQRPCWPVEWWGLELNVER